MLKWLYFLNVVIKTHLGGQNVRIESDGIAPLTQPWITIQWKPHSPECLQWTGAVEAAILPRGTDSQYGRQQEVECQCQVWPVGQPDCPWIPHLAGGQSESCDQEPCRYVGSSHKSVQDEHYGWPVPLQHDATMSLPWSPVCRSTIWHH